MLDLNDPSRITEIRNVLSRKATLRRLYQEIYEKYAACLARCPGHGLAIELGSGGGFAKSVVPELVATDVLPYTGIDLVVDATNMPFGDGSVRFFGMLNVFHHIPDVGAFLSESARCLIPGGRAFIADQNCGWLSSPILRFLHTEPYSPESKSWQFASTGPLSGANGALAWIVFVRDRSRFAREFPKLTLLQYKPTTPLRYWLTGGLKNWSLLPDRAWKCATELDKLLLRISPHFGSFVEIELLRTGHLPEARF
jgi:SAM-dependent methyltransferase